MVQVTRRWLLLLTSSSVSLAFFLFEWLTETLAAMTRFDIERQRFRHG